MLYSVTVEYRGRALRAIQVEAASRMQACEAAERLTATERDGGLASLGDYFAGKVRPVGVA